MPLLLATTFVSQVVLAEVVDIKITSLSKIKTPLNYPDASKTQTAVNSLVDGVREAAAAYFFQNVKGNYDKFQLYATTEFPSPRIMNLNLEVQMEPGFTLKNGKTKLIRRFRINLFNDGECLTQNGVTGLWEKDIAFKTPPSCEAQDNPGMGKYYSWSYAPLENSVNGACQEQVSWRVWEVTSQTLGVDKLRCEMKMKGAPESYRWRSNLPELAVHTDLRGYTAEIKAQMLQIPSTIKEVFQVINIPQDYTMEFYPEEKFQGTPTILSSPGLYHITYFHHPIKSIKVTQSPLNPEVIPPVTPATVTYRVRYRGAFDGKVDISYTRPDGRKVTGEQKVNTMAGVTYAIPYDSRNVRFRAYTFTGVEWAPTKIIFDRRASPAVNSFCAVAKGTTLSPNWREESCSI